jgi:hypothetical protein
MSPKARSLRDLRDRGFLVADVEKRLPIPGKFVTRDCYGFGDLLIAGHDPKLGAPLIGLVQVTSTGNMSAREKKIRALPEAARWLETGGAILLQGWSKRGKRGERKTWQLTERRIEKI